MRDEVDRLRAEQRELGSRTVWLYPIYHPAAALYTPRMLETLRADFARLPELLAREPLGQAVAAADESSPPADSGVDGGLELAATSPGEPPQLGLF